MSILSVQALGRDVVTDRGCDNWVGGGLAEVERGCEIIAAAWWSDGTADHRASALASGSS